MTTLQECTQLKPPEQQQTPDEDCCEAELKVIACCRGSTLRTRTIAVDLPAGTEDQIQAQGLQSANQLEANGWLILAHSWNLRSSAAGEAGGGGAVMLVTLGYYA